MSRKHPYIGLPDRQFWKKDPGIERPRQFDPVPDAPYRLSRDAKVVTAGSCFAQHLARVLNDSGYNHYIAEPAHPIVQKPVAKANNYGLFSARYGNLYTTRQLKQLIQRAYGDFEPIDQAWPGRDGVSVVDPFRPQIQPGGYASEAELAADRVQHLAAVRDALESADVFVFTLGLTECWADRRDGAVYPLAPGVAGGTYDPEIYEFRNFDETETYADLKEALDMIREKNPDVKFILTVSPVPLNATMEDRHVFVSTTWSKAVLRIAAEKAARTVEDCLYFPSFEIITSPHTRGRYYAEDRREVTEQGVRHVMSMFFRHFTNDTAGIPGLARQQAADRPAPAPARQDEHARAMEDYMQVLCDEEAISNS
ncbi:GSCFA domain-containing protein [Pseudaestuariivita atlantica]|uniref:GSCFA domain-containing protein n=1 Tax=Pseudaestuariivita atlantica TaxID=1317121 RepID=A0A0L1JMQ3_9RHOB|nr:GSCFA domain-containing protein [Pseudaestuariivita atlantica]KNG93036.1 hypothetical protein ATO11_14030 [Pseudaestuariivita atlantica]